MPDLSPLISALDDYCTAIRNAEWTKEHSTDTAQRANTVRREREARAAIFDLVTSLISQQNLPTSGNPLSVTCPNCNALAGQPCTTPTIHNDRRPVKWIHYSREQSDSGGQ